MVDVERARLAIVDLRAMVTGDFCMVAVGDLAERQVVVLHNGKW